MEDIFRMIATSGKVMWLLGSLTRPLEIAAQFALILTLIVIAWYTWETHLLRRLQVRPALILTADLQTNTLYLRNVGNSAALNIEIPDFQGAHQTIAARPNWLNFLGVNEQRGIGVHLPPGGLGGLDFEAIFAGGPLRIPLRYQDIDGHPYETLTEVTTQRTHIAYTRRIRRWREWIRRQFQRTAS